MNIFTLLVFVGGFLVLMGVVSLTIGRSTSNESTLQGPWNITITGPVGLVLVLIGIICWIPSVYKAINNGHGNVRSTPASATPAATIEGVSLSFDGPSDGTDVSVSLGFKAGGRAEAIGSRSIWILDYDSGYTVDQKAVISTGRWSAVDAPLGDTSDLPFNLTVVAVLANADCEKKLTQISATKEDYTDTLPDGCTIFGRRVLSVSRP